MQEHDDHPGYYCDRCGLCEASADGLCPHCDADLRPMPAWVHQARALLAELSADVLDRPLHRSIDVTYLQRCGGTLGTATPPQNTLRTVMTWLANGEHVTIKICGSDETDSPVHCDEDAIAYFAACVRWPWQ